MATWLQAALDEHATNRVQARVRQRKAGGSLSAAATMTDAPLHVVMLEDAGQADDRIAQLLQGEGQAGSSNTLLSW